MDKILVTGAAGFIGYHLCDSLTKDKLLVYGLDNVNDYYCQNLKLKRLEKLNQKSNFNFKKIDMADYDKLFNFFNEVKPTIVVNLAAQAGVRYSIENPFSYINSNLVGFSNLIELSKNFGVNQFIYASSSSVYGGNKKVPFSVNDRVDNPLSLYAATKRSNELIAHSYSNLFDLNTTGLRFFTVYGPWGRPDMAIYIFSDKISNGEPIQVFNNGIMKRDFTFIDDIIKGIRLSIKRKDKCAIYNLGNSKSENLLDVIKILEKNLDKKANIDFLPMQPGDVEQTFADIGDTTSKLGFNPETDISTGLKKFIDWYISYNKIPEGNRI